jgi:hypothetical protein
VGADVGVVAAVVVVVVAVAVAGAAAVAALVVVGGVVVGGVVDPFGDGFAGTITHAAPVSVTPRAASRIWTAM